MTGEKPWAENQCFFFFSLADRPIARGAFENGKCGGRSQFIMFIF